MLEIAFGTSDTGSLQSVYSDVATTRIWISLAVACVCYSDNIYDHNNNYYVDRSQNQRRVQSNTTADKRRIRLNFLHCSVYNYPIYNDTCLVTLSAAVAVLCTLNKIK